jgi:glycine cleavage system pyridoxal-binding protein P
MWDLHGVAQQKNTKSNILEVGLEDFDSSYDETTRSIFTHFLGSGDSRIDDLVEMATAHDLNRKSPERLEGNFHVSNSTEESEVNAEVRKLLKAGDGCMQQGKRWGTLMGYDAQF